MLKKRIDLYDDVLEELAFHPNVDEREIAIAVTAR